MLKWQKALVDWYGYDKLRKFTAASADEFGASNDFEIGRVAMQYDGEWRTAFIKAEHPELKYTTAPFPAADGQAGAVRLGLDRRRHRRHPEGLEAPRRGLAADQVPGDRHRRARRPLEPAARTCRRRRRPNASPKIAKDPNFAPFFKIFTNPKSEFTPLTPIGQAVRRHVHGIRRPSGRRAR